VSEDKLAWDIQGRKEWMERDGREEVSWIVGSEGMDRGEDWSGDRSGRNG